MAATNSDQYIWLLWSSAFLIPWLLVYVVFPAQRRAMLWASLFTTPFCKAPECLDTVLHKSHAASAMGVWAVRTSAGVA